MKRILSIAFLAVTLLFSFAAPAKITIVKSGAKLQKTKAEDWQLHKNSGKYYTEAWTAIMRSSEGHIIFLQFLYSNIGVVNGNTAVTLSLTLPNGSQKTYVAEHSLKEFGEDKGSNRIGVGSSWMALHGRDMTIRVRESGFNADISLKSWTDGASLYNGKMTFSDDGSDWAQTWVHIPRGDAEGTVTAGGKTFKFVGAGYVDHFAQTMLGTDYSSKWWNARWFGKDYGVAVMVIQAKKEDGGAKFGRILVVDKKGNMEYDDHVTLQVSGLTKDAKGGPKYHTFFDFNWKGKLFAVEGSFKSKRMNDRESVLDRLNAAEKAVVKMVAGNPVIYRMDGEGKLKITPAGGAAVEDTAPALMESVVLGE